MDDSRLVEMRTFIDRPMNEYESATAFEKELHSKNAHDGSDYDYILLGNSIKIPVGSRNIGGMNTALNTNHINK